MKYLRFWSLLLCALTFFTANAQQYTISPIPYNPQPFVGQSLTGSFTGADDGVSPAIQIGFDFCFYGITYSDLYVGTNGWVSFSPGQPATFTSAPIPNAGGTFPKNCIMAPWQDWWSNLSGVGNISYARVGVAPFRKFVVTFQSLPMFSCTSNLGTFQVVLNECSNTIEVYILEKPACTWASGTAVLGLHNLLGTAAHTVAGRNSTNWTVVPTAPEGWLFTPDESCAGGAFGGFASIDTTSLWPIIEADCYTGVLGLKVAKGDLNCASIDPGGSDFRLYSPQGSLLQIRDVDFVCNGGKTDSITITTAFDFLFNGDHYLVVRNGIDGNPLLGDCGTGTFAFDTIIVRVTNCYEYNEQVDMLNVSVNRDNESKTITWSSPQNFDASFFEIYRLYVNDSSGSNNWREFAQTYDINDTSLVTSEAMPSSESKDFKAVLRIRYYGDIRAIGDSVNNILLSAAGDELTNGLRGMASIRWTPYKAWNSNYEIYVAAWEDTSLGRLVGSTTDTVFSFEKPIEIGKYRVQVMTTETTVGRIALSNYVPFEMILREVEIPNVITPNGDGANDVFLVKGLEFFPENTVELFNRWGQRVFKAENYKNDYMPSDLESGTYIYKVTIPDKEVKQGPIKIIK